MSGTVRPTDAFGPGGYYETRCKWCGGSQHARGADCPARVAACTCTFEYPKCVCRGSQADGEVVTIAREALSGARTADELAVGCHRSHPHENMDAGCQRLTEIARENNAAANMGTEARCWHCGMVTLKAHYDDCPASGARTATDTGGKPDA